MENITAGMIEKLKGAKAPEELLDMLKEAEIEISVEEAKMYFDHLNGESGELSDDELDNVSGGGCKRASGKTTVTNGCKCFNGHYENNCFWSGMCYEGGTKHYCESYYREDNSQLRSLWRMFCSEKAQVCGTCRWLSFEGCIGVCDRSLG